MKLIQIPFIDIEIFHKERVSVCGFYHHGCAVNNIIALPRKFRKYKITLVIQVKFIEIIVVFLHRHGQGTFLQAMQAVIKEICRNHISLPVLAIDLEHHDFTLILT